MFGFKSHLSSSFFIFHGKRDVQVNYIALIYVGLTVSMNRNFANLIFVDGANSYNYEHQIFGTIQ